MSSVGIRPSPLPTASGRPRGVNEPAAGIVNVPNLITGVRTAVAIAVAVVAITRHSEALLAAAYVTYWAGDILDGASARLLGQETRIGAVFDILADRACTSLCLAALLMIRPEMALPLGIFFAQFMVLDTLLSLAFLRWPILSPNYFGQVDRGIHRWNWSPPAKALNTGAVVILVVVTPSPIYPALLAAGITVTKAVSLWAVTRVPSWSDHEPFTPR